MTPEVVSQIVNKLGVTGLLDYHCGDASLFRSLKADHEMKLQCYDPNIPAFSGKALPMQMVTCIDVLQDVDPKKIDSVLDDLQRVTEVVGFFSIRQDEKEPRINKDKAWWLDKIMTRFDLQSLQTTPTGYFMIVYALPKPLIERATIQ
jgi:hypothetical protein